VANISPRLEKLFAILHEDADLLVVNKPAGLVCHPTKGDEFSSLISRARLHLNRSLPASVVRGDLQPSAFSLQPFLVHRLDRETSGVVILAKKSETAGELGKLLEARAVQKEYLAIVHGHVRDDHGVIDAPLGKDQQSQVAVKDCVRSDGAPARTEFWVERRFVRPVVPYEDEFSPDKEPRRDGGPFSLSARPTGREGRLSSVVPRSGTKGESEVGLPSTYSLLRIIPHTGRKHQIRLHLAHLGHPIVGDKLYGGDEDLYLALVQNRLTPEQRARLIFPNQALHARAVRLVWRGQPVEFSCAPEPWFSEFAGTP